MRFRVHVDSLGDWDRWVESMNQPPAELTAGSAEERGARVFQLAGGCVACHTIQGTAAQGKLGPDLTLFGNRTTLASGILENNQENLVNWIKDVRSIKPILDEPRFMPTFNTGDPATDKLTDQQIADVSAYLKSLDLR